MGAAAKKMMTLEVLPKNPKESPTTRSQVAPTSQKAVTVGVPGYEKPRGEYSKYLSLFNDEDYLILSRVFTEEESGIDSEFSTKFPMSNVENVRVNHYGYQNKIRAVTYSAKLNGEAGAVVELYQKKNVKMKI